MQILLRSQLVPLTDNNFQPELERSLLPFVVDFYATWCLPARSPNPILSDLLAKFDRHITIGRLDIATAKEVAKKYEIRAVPTLVIFKNGKIVYRVIGSPSLAEIVQHLNL